MRRMIVLAGAALGMLGGGDAVVWGVRRNGCAKVPIFVHDSDGRPVAEYGTLKCDNGLTTSVGGDTAGKIEVTLPAEEGFSLSFFNPFRFARVQVLHEAGAAFPEVMDVRLEGVGAIGGRVVDGSGRPVAGAVVSLAFHRKFESALERLEPGCMRTWTDHEGRWSVSSIPAVIDSMNVEADAPGVLRQLGTDHLPRRYNGSVAGLQEGNGELVATPGTPG